MNYTLNKKGNIVTKKPIKTFKNLAIEQQQVFNTGLKELDKVKVKLTEIRKQQEQIVKVLESLDLINTIFPKVEKENIKKSIENDFKKSNETSFVNNLSRENLKTLKQVEQETGFSAYQINQEVKKGNLKRVAMSGKSYFLDRDIENWKFNIINKK